MVHRGDEHGNEVSDHPEVGIWKILRSHLVYRIHDVEYL
jgi:hypothetical protein